jgi:hypothetical protein
MPLKTAVFHFLVVSVDVLLPGVELMPFRKITGHFVAPDLFFPGLSPQDFIWGHVIRGTATYQYNVCYDDNCDKCRILQL